MLSLVHPSCKVGFLLCVFCFVFCFFSPAFRDSFLCSFCHPIHFIRVFEMCLWVQTKGSGFQKCQTFKVFFLGEVTPGVGFAPFFSMFLCYLFLGHFLTCWQVCSRASVRQGFFSHFCAASFEKRLCFGSLQSRPDVKSDLHLQTTPDTMPCVWRNHPCPALLEFVVCVVLWHLFFFLSFFFFAISLLLLWSGMKGEPQSFL